MSVGENKSNSTDSSRPLTAGERAAIFESAYSYMNPYTSAKYNAPTYQGLSGGDYNQLENALMESKAAGINRAWDLEKDSINQEAADRGIWDSGIPLQTMQKRYEEAYIPQFTQAANEATAQRYGLQSEDLKGANAFNMTNAGSEFDAAWRPADYWAGIYNQTNGTISNGESKSKGWNINWI